MNLLYIKQKVILLLVLLAIYFLIIDFHTSNKIINWAINLNPNIWVEALVQGAVVGLTILGGLWVNRRIENEKLTREIIGSLDSITAEVGYDLVAIGLIKECILQRPTLVDRTKFSSVDEILRYCRDEEEYVARYTGQLTDKAYFAVLPTLSKIFNRQLFEDIINEYTKLRNLKFVMQLRSMDGPIGSSISEKDAILAGEDSTFKLWVTKIEELSESLNELDGKLRLEIRELKSI